MTSSLNGTPKKSQRKPYEVMKAWREAGSSLSMALRRLSLSLATSSLREAGVNAVWINILGGRGGEGDGGREGSKIKAKWAELSHSREVTGKTFLSWAVMSPRISTESFLSR